MVKNYLKIKEAKEHKRNTNWKREVSVAWVLVLFIFSFSIVIADEWIHLDGVNGEVIVDDSTTLDGFSQATWNMWIWQDSYTKYAGIAGKYKANTGARAYLIRTSIVNGNPVVSIALSKDGITVGSYTSESTLKCGTRDNNEWTMITITYDGSLITYYRNGEICDTDTTTIDSIYSSTSPLRLGGGNSIFFNGGIDEYTFYDKKLEPEQIKRLYDESVHGANLGDSIPVLVYHKIASPANDLIIVTPENFAAQMNYLNQNNFTTVTLKDYLDWKNGDLILPKKSIILVFDDGFKTVLDEAKPIMDQYGFVGTVATVTRYASFTGDNTGYLRWREIDELVDSGWDIESHSVTHSHMLRLSESEFRSELINSKNAITSNTKKTPTSFVFPFHESNPTYTKICGEYYDLCWTQGSLNPSYDFISNDGKAYLGLRRINVVNSITIDDFANFLRRDTDKFAEWNMDEGTKTTTADTSGNSNTGNLVSGALWSSKINTFITNSLLTSSLSTSSLSTNSLSTSSSIIEVSSTINNSENKKEKGKSLDGLDNVIDSDHEKAPVKILKEKKKYPDNMNIEGKYYETHNPIKLEEDKEKTKNKTKEKTKEKIKPNYLISLTLIFL